MKNLMKHLIAWSVAAAVVVGALIAASSQAHADTLVIWHPDTIETMTGSFEQLNMQQDHERGGGLELHVVTYDSQIRDAHSKRVLQAPNVFKDGFDNLLPGWWEISLDIPPGMDGPGGYSYFQYRCDGLFHYGPEGNSRLDLMCID